MYDINCDGQITKEEMTDIVTAIYNLMGHPVEEKIDDDRIKAKVDRIFDVSRSVLLGTQTYDLHFLWRKSFEAELFPLSFFSPTKVVFCRQLITNTQLCK